MLKKVVISSNKIVQFHSHVFFIDLYEDNKSLEFFRDCTLLLCSVDKHINANKRSDVELKKVKQFPFYATKTLYSSQTHCY